MHVKYMYELVQIYLHKYIKDGIEFLLRAIAKSILKNPFLINVIMWHRLH